MHKDWTTIDDTQLTDMRGAAYSRYDALSEWVNGEYSVWVCFSEEVTDIIGDDEITTLMAVSRVPLVMN